MSKWAFGVILYLAVPLYLVGGLVYGIYKACTEWTKDWDRNWEQQP